ncbi:MAG: histidine phosphatase family protein [bacterium]
MELYLIRHGESTWNRDDRVQGQSNPCLSEKGKKQAELLKNRLSGISFDFVYSSHLRRAYDTAKISFDGRYKIERDKRLSEINLGVWEGISAKKLFKESGEFRSWFEKTSEITPENGESLFEFRDRVISFFNELMKNKKEKKGLIFTHSGVIGIFLAHFLEMNLNKVWSIPTSNGSITIVNMTNPFFTLITFNDTSHLV